MITAFQPHMHNRGQAQCLELMYPSAGVGDRPGGVRTETVSCVDRFKFNWHVVYEYSDDVAPIVPAGTILHVISLYDNTSGNAFNPDPSNWVGFGNRTIDEMGFSWINWYYLSDEEYKQAVADRAKLKVKSSASPDSRWRQDDFSKPLRSASVRCYDRTVGSRVAHDHKRVVSPLLYGRLAALLRFGVHDGATV